MRILIFGPNGQLGNSLKDLQPKGMRVLRRKVGSRPFE